MFTKLVFICACKYNGATCKSQVYNKCKSFIKLTPGSLLENVAKSKERTKGEGEGEGREGSTLAPYLPTRSLFTG